MGKDLKQGAEEGREKWGILTRNKILPIFKGSKNISKSNLSEMETSSVYNKKKKKHKKTPHTHRTSLDILTGKVKA